MYQLEAVDKIIGLFRSGCDSVQLSSPVGSGKTVMAGMVIERMEKLLNRKLIVGWIVPRRHLVKQVEEMAEQFNLTVIPISMFVKKEKIPKCDFCVIDESHHQSTNSCINVYLSIGASYILGLSGTPLRTDRMKLSFKQTVNDVSIKRLVNERYLAQIHSYMLPDYNVDTVIWHYLKNKQEWGKTIVFLPSIGECLHFSEEMHKRGIGCEFVRGANEAERERQLELFKGDLDLIVNCQVLTEGFDMPGLKTVFAKDGSRLPVTQMCGRALRLCEGKKYANIVQTVNTKFPVSNLACPELVCVWQNGKFISLSGTTDKIINSLINTMKIRAMLSADPNNMVKKARKGLFAERLMTA
jgi:superfamily II DNA or RNA helicase